MTEFVNASALRALAYVQAASAAHAPLTGSQLDAFNSERVPEWTSIFERLRLDNHDGPDRSMARYLKNVGWVSAGRGDVLTITDLGAAVLKSQGDVQSDVDPFELVIRSEVPLDYAALYREISRTTDAMIVDAYFPAAALEYVGPIEEVKRLLISETHTHADGKWASRRLDFSRTLNLGGYELEVRYVPTDQKSLHDRFVLPARGSGLMLGGSFGGMKPNTVVTMSAETTAQHRAYYDAIWEVAEPLTPEPSAEAPEGTNA